MKWVTRERARVDRIACPWLISRFVDRDAVFLFVHQSRLASSPPSPPNLPLPRCQELFSGMLFVPIVKLARATRARELTC